MRCGRLNARKKQLTAQSSARCANEVIAGNDDQYWLACEAQYRHIVGLKAAIAAIDPRLAARTTDILTVAQRKTRRTATAVKGYATQKKNDNAAASICRASSPPLNSSALAGSAAWWRAVNTSPQRAIISIRPA
ncbi:hypothetical protein [Mycobacterium stomatepiae]|uniref:Uncharacterized protein n=1 Tax=Mycobacterium stomatepiae TaxID=470076 RepID=A0A7I7Q7A9_9MYCO|nr:hypothetical protein [Mycobacterium stomatepiae]MCV7163067.1 hypothetical protein [Mycobacterium stomatepiae]BBY22224.1 hypothetical protein MSTO_24290 [Mycobacterium stomatepiae]